MKFISLVAAACVAMFASVSEAKSAQMQGPAFGFCMNTCNTQMRDCISSTMSMNDLSARRNAMDTCRNNVESCTSSCRNMPVRGPDCMQTCSTQMRDCMNGAMSMSDPLAKRNAVDMCRNSMDMCGTNCRGMPMPMPVMLPVESVNMPRPGCMPACSAQMRDCMNDAMSQVPKNPMAMEAAQRAAMPVCAQKMDACRRNCM